MRKKLFLYLPLFYLLTFVGFGLYRLLAPPPPKPPSAWETAWREHGNIVAYAAMIMLTLIQIAVGIVFLGGALVLLKKGWTIWAQSLGRTGGLAPVVRDQRGEWYDPNPEGAVIAAAIAAHSPRVTAAMARNMLGAALDRGPLSVQDASYADAPLLVDGSYEVVEEFRSDMVDATGHGAQHHIFVGPTGSGKSVAAYSVLEEMQRQQPNAEFYIFEPGGVEWKSQAAVTTFEGLFDLVRHFHEEMRRRQQLLAAHPSAVHAFQLGLSPVILFIEEAGAALDHYKLSPGGRKLANEFLLYLRNLLREGRKAGIGVVLVDQSAMAETVDTQVLDNVSGVWILTRGVSPRLLRRWGLTEDFRRLQQAGLIQNRPGLAYSYHDRQLVQFPLRERPMLAAKSSATLKRDGVADASAASRTAMTTSVSAQKPAVQYALPPTRRSDGTLNDDGVRMDRQNVISKAAAMRVYRTYQELGSISKAQQALFPGQTTGGHWFYWIRDIIEQVEGRRRQRPTVTIVDGSGAGGEDGRSYRRTVQAPRVNVESGDAAVRRVAEQRPKQVPYTIASVVLSMYRRRGSVEAVHRHLWPDQPVDDRRAAWLESVIEQMLRGRPDSYGPVVVVGWPET